MNCTMCNHELKHCEICNGHLLVSKINSEFFECDHCKTQIRIENNESFSKLFYDTEYLQDIPGEIKVLTVNKHHYDLIFELFEQNQSYLDFVQDVKDNDINTCYCYGGGFPQVEIHLPTSNIVIYDLIANVYRKHLHIFKELHELSNIKIQYKNHDLLKGILPTSNKSIVSFVHILEHFPISDVKQILQSAADNLPDGSYGIIYQPNISEVKGKNWVHYISQHMSFIPLDTFVTFINSIKNLSVVFKMSYSDDLFIVFKIIK